MDYTNYPPGRTRRLMYSEELVLRNIRRSEYTGSYGYQRSQPPLLHTDYINSILQTESLNSYIHNSIPIPLLNFIYNTEVIIDIENAHFCCICQNAETFMLMRKIIKCNHIFHIRCLKKWGKDHNDCPMCRIVI
jgi:hypothetical protein